MTTGSVGPVVEAVCPIGPPAGHPQRSQGTARWNGTGWEYGIPAEWRQCGCPGQPPCLTVTRTARASKEGIRRFT